MMREDYVQYEVLLSLTDYQRILFDLIEYLIGLVDEMLDEQILLVLQQTHHILDLRHLYELKKHEEQWL